jgi:hypothetical protein
MLKPQGVVKTGTMTMADFNEVFTAERIASGMTWPEYLDKVPRSRAMQARRYEAAAEEIESRSRSFNGKLILLTMPQCGDCAWAVPRIAAWADGVEGAELRLFIRSENEDMMDLLLTNGKRSVPKAALLDEAGRLCATWGPRPREIQGYVERSIGVVDGDVWRKEVLKYQKSQGVKALYRELDDMIA